MKFLTLYRPDVRTAATPASPELMADMGRFLEEMLSAGVLVATGGLLPAANSARLRSAGGTVTVIDDPFAESQEPLGGFALIEVASKAEAVEVCRRFLAIAGGGLSEIHQVMDAPPDLPD